MPQVSPEPRFESREGGRNMEMRRPVVGNRAWRCEKLVGSRGGWCREVGSRTRVVPQSGGMLLGGAAPRRGGGGCAAPVRLWGGVASWVGAAKWGGATN